jgi:endonuclease/exonuclease/phosphatase (EEP) superfamily protein YafD
MGVISDVVRCCRGIVTAVVLVVGLATLLGLLDRVFWVFETADVFRLQYLVLLLAAALAALILRRSKLALVAVVLAAVNAAVMGIPMAATATAVGARPRGSLRVLVTNVAVGNTDFAAVDRLVAQSRPDVLGVIELTPPMARHLRAALPLYRVRVLKVRDDAYGIGVYSRLPLLSAKIARFPSDGPPTVVARVLVAGKPVSVVVTHVHTTFAGSIHVRHLDALAAAARSQLGKRVVVCGDFNTPPWSGPLRDFAADAHVRDLYGGRAWAGYSWPTWGYGLRVPLDNCFLSNSVAVTGHHDGPSVGSDHRPLVVDIGVLK